MFKSLYRSIQMVGRMLKNALLRPFRTLYAQFRRSANVTRQASKVVPKVVKSVTKVKLKPTQREDYVDAGSVFIAKSLIVVIVLALIAAILLGIYVIWPWMERTWFTAHMYHMEEKAMDYSGKVCLYYDEEKTEVMYEGRLEEGLRTGKGKEYHLNGIPMYEGSFAENVYSGNGVMQDEAGNPLYEGDFDQGQYHGEGKLYNEGVLVYEGEFVEGKREGEGTAYESGIRVYEGEFVNNAYEGMGKLFYANGQVSLESPSFVAGSVNGTGVAYHESGEKLYEGSFVSGQYEGQGTMYYTNGQRQYTGAFVKGQYEGEGQLFYENGKRRYEGGFFGGQYEGQGVLLNADGSIQYEGGFLAGKYEGQGKLNLGSGRAVEGTFASGATVGDVKFYMDNVLFYEGTMVDGTMHGVGKRYSADGRVIFNGTFNEGMIDPHSLIGKSVTDLRQNVFAQAVTTEAENDLGFVIKNEDLSVAIFCNYGINEEEIVVHRVFLYGEQLSDQLAGNRFVVPKGYMEIDEGRETPMELPGVAATQVSGRKGYTRYLYENYTIRLWQEGEYPVDLLEWRSYRLLPDEAAEEADEEGQALQDLLEQLGFAEPEEDQSAEEQGVENP